MRLEGTITALVTPFIGQQLDEEGLVQNIHHQIAAGVSGILVLGTTGEAATLSHEEQERVISLAVREAKGKVDVWVGTGSYCTRQAIEKTQRAKELGADGVLVVTPYYNKPSQEGVFRHYEALTAAVEIPVMLYNIPGRCGINIEPTTLLRIAGLPNIVGVKESTGNIQQTSEIILAMAGKYPDFKVFSGDDALILPMMALGAVGIVSVVSNLIPEQIVALSNALLQGDLQRAREIHFRLLPFIKVAFIESNPVPIKSAMELCGLPAGGCRLPLYKMEVENLSKLRQQLVEMQLIGSLCPQ